VFRLTYEKECLSEILDVTKVRESQLQQKKEMQPNSDNTEQPQLNDSDRPSTAEELLKQLEPYPHCSRLLLTMISNYELRISSLQQKLCE
jgi:hypothetical protein